MTGCSIGRSKSEAPGSYLINLRARPFRGRRKPKPIFVLGPVSTPLRLEAWLQDQKRRQTGCQGIQGSEGQSACQKPRHLCE